MRGEFRLALVLLGSLYVASESLADDQQQNLNSSLKGVFRSVGINNCLESQGGFTSNLLFQVNGFAARYQENTMSTAVFPGDGTMTDNVRGTTYFQGDPYNPGNFGAGTFIGTCQYTFNMNPNKSFTLKGSCNGSSPLGPAINTTSTLTGVVHHAQLSDDGNTIIIGNPEPNAQLLALSNQYSAQRLCGTSATYVRVR